MTYNRKQLCILGGVAYTALQSLQRQWRDPFETETIGEGVAAYSERAAYKLALAASLVPGVGGTSLSTAFELVEAIEAADGLPRLAQGPYMGIGILPDGKVRVHSGTLSEIDAWERNAVHNGHPLSLRLTLVNVDQVVAAMQTRAAAAGVPLDTADL